MSLSYWSITKKKKVLILWRLPNIKVFTPNVKKIKIKCTHQVLNSNIDPKKQKSNSPYYHTPKRKIKMGPLGACNNNS